MEWLLVAGCRLLAKSVWPPDFSRNRQPATRNLVAGAAALALAACFPAPPPRPLAHEAYVWQRQWTPAVAAAVRAQAPRFAGWRVLALQVVGDEVIEVRPDLAALRAAGLPLRAVVRIEGARERPDAAMLAARIDALRQAWQAAGLRSDGIEVDHDCATAGLADYARWLRELDAALAGGGALSITALPDWLRSPALDELLAVADLSVLQVHAVDQPQRGLIDRARALAWTQAWAGRTPRPFLVALPAYGVRVGVDAAGQVRAVDAEGHLDGAGAGASELRADAGAVAAFIAAVAADPPPALAGWAWFRLPVAGDRRGWSPAQLAAVIADAPLRTEFVVEASPADADGQRLRLRNAGNLDAPPPPLQLPAACQHADGLGRYRLQATAPLRLAPDAQAWLPAGSRVEIGWARCAEPLPPAWSVR